MRLGIDMDGVVCNYQQYFIDILNKDKGTSYTLNDWEDWSFSSADFKEGEFEERVNESMKFIEHLAPIEGALQGIRKLRNHHTIHIMTNRFLEGRVGTLKWLDNYGVDFQSLTFTDKKGVLSSILNLDLVIEDSGFHAKDITNHGVKVLLYNKLYNQDFYPMRSNVKRPDGSETPFLYRSERLIERVNNWDDITKLLT